MTPTRAKVRRVWAFIQGRSSVGPERDGVRGEVAHQGGRVGGLEGAEGVADAVRLDLDQRLQPDHPARAVADDLDRDAGGLGGGADRLGHGVGAERAGGGVAGDEDLHHRSASAIVAGVARPTSRPSTSAAGPQAQRPRQ